MSNRFPFFLAALLFPLAGLAEFANPLTSGPSKDLNTWLLGVWEYKAEGGKTYRATVTPKTGDRYWVAFKEPGSRGKEALFEAWISRVGRTSFLTLKCIESDGLVAPETYLFGQYTVLDQNTVRMRRPSLDVAPDTSSYQLRVQARRKIKANELFPDRGTDWSRISEVYWADEPGPQPFQPLRDPPIPVVETAPDRDVVEEVVEEVIEVE